MIHDLVLSLLHLNENKLKAFLVHKHEFSTQLMCRLVCNNSTSVPIDLQCITRFSTSKRA